MKKNFLLISILLLVAILCSGCAIVKPTVLTIDGEEVSLSEYNYYFSLAKLQAEQSISPDQLDMYWKTEKDGKTTFELLKETAYNEMLDLRIAAKKAEKMGINVNDTAVRQAAINFKNQIMQMATSESEFYEMTDTDAETITKIANMYALRSVMVDKLIADGVINVSDEAVIKYLNENYYKAQHILISTQDTATGAPIADSEKETKKKLAEDILARVNKGENFTNLMNEFSEDPGKAELPDGYVFTDGEMVVEFEEAVKALEPDANSGIVESTYGYHIIKRLPLDAQNEVKTLEEKRESIQSELVMEYLTLNVPQWKNEMKITENKESINKIKL